jgi:hypothetical protein
VVRGPYLGARVPLRSWLKRLVEGRGVFVDDIVLPHMLNIAGWVAEGGWFKLEAALVFRSIVQKAIKEPQEKQGHCAILRSSPTF